MKTHSQSEDRVDRRTFLRAAGVSLALPLMESRALADASPPKRTVFMSAALGLHPPSLYPSRSGTNRGSSEYLTLLKEHRSEFTLFSGLSHPDQGGEHETEKTFLSAARNPEKDGFKNSISIDQVMAKDLGYITRFPSLSISSNGAKSQSFTNGGVMLPAEHSPSSLFAKLFLDGTAQEVEEQKRKLADGRSDLDELMAQAKMLRSRSTAADREKLDEYFESVRQTERDLKEARAWMDRPKPKVGVEQPTDIPDKTDLIGRIKLLVDMVPLIIQTDSTRVLSLVIQDHYSVPQVPGVTSEHHHLSHHGRDPEKISQLKMVEREIVKQFGALLDQMKSKKEAGGSLLDQTSVLFGSNLGNANAHDPRNLPIFVAGGGFNHGGLVQKDHRDNTPLSNLFVTLVQNMGIETDAFATSTGSLTW